MKLAQRIELIFGIATGVLEVLSVGVLLVTDFSGNQVWEWIIGALLFCLAPGFLVAFGSHLHVRSRKTVGLVMLFVGALPVMIFAYIFFGISYLYGRSAFGFIFLLPFFTALVSGIASLFSVGKIS